jgi:hypothetical protein
VRVDDGLVGYGLCQHRDVAPVFGDQPDCRGHGTCDPLLLLDASLARCMQCVVAECMVVGDQRVLRRQLRDVRCHLRDDLVVASDVEVDLGSLAVDVTARIEVHVLIVVVDGSEVGEHEDEVLQGDSELLDLLLLRRRQ